MKPREIMDEYARNMGYLDWSDLHEQSTDHIEEYTEDLIQSTIVEEWVGHEIQCQICTYKWWGVFEINTPKLECPRCGHMTSYNL